MQLILIILLFILSCSPHSSHIKAEIVDLIDNKPTEYTLKTVTLNNVIDINKLSGNFVKFFRDIRLSQEEFLKVIALSSSFIELEKAMKGLMNGKDPTMHLLNRDGVFRSQTIETLMMLSAYYHVDKILKFARASLNADDKITGKLTIGIYGEIVTDKNSKIPLITHDNALYIPGIDTVFLLRVGDQQGLPLAMHPGVLAHEIHHRVFFFKVWNNENFNLWSKWQNAHKIEDYSKPNRSQVLLNATDEGLADLFAVAFSRSPSFLNASLITSKDIKIARQRDLLGDFANKATYDNLADSSLDADLLKTCTDHAFDFKNSRFSFYCLGTVLAKTIFDASMRDIDFLRNTVLKMVFDSLGDIAKELASNREYDMDIILSALAHRAKNTHKAFFENLCQQIELRFNTLFKSKLVSVCAH